jgi:acyl-CoA thioesterase FadM
VATLLDEAMSKTNRARNIVAMTRHMEVDYLRPVPLRTKLQLTAKHLSSEGRKHYCVAELRNAAGELLATGKALFITVDPVRLSARQSRDPL